jgi:methylase of polypeptide subunit release factors
MADLQHHLFLLSLGDLHLAPISKTPHNVLDIGTGTGIWAIDFGTLILHPSDAILTSTAQQYPTANVLGTDLSPIQPE